jgi:hypothetical protein
LRPVLNIFPGRGEGQFFFVTNEKKRAYLEAQGKQVGDGMAYGMPVVVIGAVEEPPATGDTYGVSDVTVFNVIKDSEIAKDFQDFIGQFPDSAFAPYARNRVAVLHQRDTAMAPPTVTARIDPATEETGLNLRPEDRRVVQEALTALDFDTRGTDGVFGANTRRAIISWQRANGEEPTGYLNASQYGRLLAEAEPKLVALASQLAKFNANIEYLNRRALDMAGAELFAGIEAAGDRVVQVRTTPTWDAMPPAAQRSYLNSLLDLWIVVQDGTTPAVVRIVDASGRVLLEKSAP